MRSVVNIKSDEASIFATSPFGPYKNIYKFIKTLAIKNDLIITFNSIITFSKIYYVPPYNQ